MLTSDNADAMSEDSLSDIVAPFQLHFGINDSEQGSLEDVFHALPAIHKCGREPNVFCPLADFEEAGGRLLERCQNHTLVMCSRRHLAPANAFPTNGQGAMRCNCCRATDAAYRARRAAQQTANESVPPPADTGIPTQPPQNPFNNNSDLDDEYPLDDEDGEMDALLEHLMGEALSMEDRALCQEFHRQAQAIRMQECSRCEERWFNIDVENGLCAQCRKLDAKGRGETFTAANHMSPGTLPQFVLDNPEFELTQIEEILISPVHAMMSVMTIVGGGQTKYSGHVCNFPRDQAEFCHTLPRLPEECDVICVQSSMHDKVLDQEVFKHF